MKGSRVDWCSKRRWEWQGNGGQGNAGRERVGEIWPGRDWPCGVLISLLRKM